MGQVQGHKDDERQAGDETDARCHRRPMVTIGEEREEQDGERGEMTTVHPELDCLKAHAAMAGKSALGHKLDPQSRRDRDQRDRCGEGQLKLSAPRHQRERRPAAREA